MALTLTEKFRENTGSGKTVGYLITHDGSTVNLSTGASIDFDYFTWVDAGPIAYASALALTSANASVFASHLKVSINADGNTISWDAVPESGSTQRLVIRGW